MYVALLANFSMIDSNVLSHYFIGPNIDDTLRAIRQGKVTDEDVNKLLAVFQTQGTDDGS